MAAPVRCQTVCRFWLQAIVFDQFLLRIHFRRARASNQSNTSLVSKKKHTTPAHTLSSCRTTLRYTAHTGQVE